MSVVIDDLLNGMFSSRYQSSQQINDESQLSSAGSTTNSIDALTNDELIDIFLYYVDDLYEEKINELTVQIRLYGLVACAVITLFILIGLLFVTVWLFALTNKADSDDKEDSEKTNTITNNILAQNFSSTDDKLPVDIYKDEIYVSQWDLPLKIKQKAIFWKAPISKCFAIAPDYKDYESILNLYEKNTEPSCSNRNSQLDLNDLAYETDNNNSLDLASWSRTNSIQQTVTAFYAKSQTSSAELSCISLGTPTKFQNISLIDEEDGSSNNSYNTEDGVGYDSTNEPVSERNDNIHSSQSFTQPSKLSVSNAHSVPRQDLHHTLSYRETIKLARVGPAYLKQYLTIIYGNGEDFEYRSLRSYVHNDSTIMTNDENVQNALDFLNHKDYISDEETIETLRFLRYSYLLPLYQQKILISVIENIKFLCNMLKEKKNNDDIKPEIFQLFYCIIWCESTIHLPSTFVANVVEEMMISLSYMDSESTLFKECFRCFEGTMIYFNFDDFENKLFDRIFINVNDYSFERQNIIWESLKLFICQWLLETATEASNIYRKLRRKVEAVISDYVEKDNLKYQEFLLIWIMLKHTKTAKIEIEYCSHGIGESNETETENENQKLKGSLIKMRNITNISDTKDAIVRNELLDITNFN